MLNSQKGFAQVLVLLFLLLAIPIGLYLVQHPAIFKPKAAENENSGKIDVISFMNAKFNYNGFTEQNSYLALRSHSYNKQSGKWEHATYEPSCPPEFNNNCTGLNWGFRYMTRQKPGENILYLSKGVTQPGKADEVFWFNNKSVYDFQEPSSYDNPADAWDTSIYGLFHNYSHPIDKNPNLDFPNRGQYWSDRYITPGWESPLFGKQLIKDYRNMKYLRTWTYPYMGKVKVNYYPAWDSSKDTWNNQKDDGNLPQPLEVIVDEQTSFDDAGKPVFVEKYFYAKNSSNSFGIIRFESWNPKKDVCGSDTCCTIQTCDGNYPLTISVSNTMNVLKHYDDGEDPEKYFNPSFYSDPKLETTPTNGAEVRGKIQLPSGGQTWDGQKLNKGDWLTLTEILTDDDWLISPALTLTEDSQAFCPDGYFPLGSVVTNFVDHKGKPWNNTWAVFCAINKNALLAESCPADYYSRGSINTAGLDKKSAYDSQNNEVGGKNINFCVHYNEFHFPKLSAPSSPSPSPSSTPSPSPSKSPSSTPTVSLLRGRLQGSSSIQKNKSGSYKGTVYSTGNNLTRIEMYVDHPAGTQNWSLIGKGSCSGEKCTLTQKWTPTEPGTYTVMVNGYDANNANCTGNPYYNYTNSTTWKYCGSGSSVKVEVVNNTVQNE